MRKLLLASVAVLGASAVLANYATAQTVIYSQDPNAPRPTPQLFERLTAGAAAKTYAPPKIKQSTPEPAPGQMIVRLDGWFVAYQQFTANGQAKTPPPAGSAPGVGGNKLSNYDFYSFARLYPSLEGRATNGLKYGAFLEIRQDNAAGAGGGTYGSISGTDQSRGKLYFRREYGYFGTDKLGMIRVGAGDQPTSLFITGTMENFDNGGFNGDVQYPIPSGLNITYPFEDVGNLYSTEKIVYLSPQFAGFDFGVSYEPNTNAVGDSSGCGTALAASAVTVAAPSGGAGATAGCNALSSTGVNGELSRRKNTFDGVLRYRGAFGPVGVAATGGFIFSSKVQSSDTPAAFAASKGIAYDGLSVGDFGLTATFAGLILGGHVTFGDFNPASQWNKLNPSGEPDGIAYIVGASYQPAPNFIFGAHYLKDWGAGNQNPLNAPTGVGQLTEQGVAFGATYSVTPGFNFFLSGIWQEHKESGYNFIQNSTTSTGPLGSGLNQFDNNKTSSWAVALGEAFHW